MVAMLPFIQDAKVEEPLLTQTNWLTKSIGSVFTTE